MTRPLESLATLIGLCAWLAMGTAMARTSDRDQPMDLVSNTSDCNIDGGTCQFAGNVQIDQGTLAISAARGEMHRANGELSSVILTGSPVVLKQIMDDGSSMTARASKVDYDLDTDIVIFTGNVEIKQPRGILSGERVVYNMTSGQVRSGGEGNGRVKMRILPANSNGSSANASEDASADDASNNNETPKDGG